jgi:hypothetical protein
VKFVRQAGVCVESGVSTTILTSKVTKSSPCHRFVPSSSLGVASAAATPPPSSADA